MLPDPVSQAAQLFDRAMPKLARKAYRIAFAAEPCVELAITLPLIVLSLLLCSSWQTSALNIDIQSAFSPCSAAVCMMVV
jgi:uncharacterized membrane protein